MGSQLMHYGVYDSSANSHTLLMAEPTRRTKDFYLTDFSRVFLPPVFLDLLSMIVTTPPFLAICLCQNETLLNL